MLWYPVKAYGDFRLKLQFREGRDRRRLLQRRRLRALPEPGADPARRTSARSSARPPTQPAWVAIYCGHEIQLYDGETGESRKTGSVYTFDNNNIDRDRRRRSHAASGRTTRSRSSASTTRSAATARSSTSARTARASSLGPRGRPEHDAAAVHARLHRPAEPRRRGHDAVPQHPRRGPDAGRARGRGRHRRRSRSPAPARTRSRSARSTRPATSRPSSRSTSRSGALRARRVRRPPPRSSRCRRRRRRVLPPMIDTPASYRLGSVTSRITRATFARRGLAVPIVLHGRDDRLGEADGLERDASAGCKLSQQRRSTRERRALLGPAHGQGDAQAVLGAGAATRPARAARRSVKLTLTVQMRDWGKPAQTDAEDDHAAALKGLVEPALADARGPVRRRRAARPGRC